MARVKDKKEQVQQELYDTLLRGVGATTAAASTDLFRAQNTGSPELTNMQEGGRLSNEEEFLCLSVRFYTQFFNQGASPNSAALYRWMEDGIMWTLVVGRKPMIGPLPLFVAPGGGGLFGYDVGTAAHVLTNGAPGWGSILKFAKPIMFERNQHFHITAAFYAFQSYDGGTTAAVNPLTVLNTATDLKVIKCFLGGILERDVQ